MLLTPSSFLDNRPVPKAHFAAIAMHPPPAKPAPAIIQTISTAGSSSGAGSLRSRQSLVPVSKVPRASISGGHQPFVLPNSRKGLPSFVERIKEEESSDRSGSFGLGLTEKEIDDRVRLLIIKLSSYLSNTSSLQLRYQELWRPRSPDDWRSERDNAS